MRDRYDYMRVATKAKKSRMYSRKVREMGNRLLGKETTKKKKRGIFDIFLPGKGKKEKKAKTERITTKEMTFKKQAELARALQEMGKIEKEKQEIEKRVKEKKVGLPRKMMVEDAIKLADSIAYKRAMRILLTEEETKLEKELIKHGWSPYLKIKFKHFRKVTRIPA